MNEPSFNKLLKASRELLSSRYSDGEVDAVAMARFVSTVEEIDPINCHLDHRIITNNTSPFKPRRGCIDCDVWIDPVEITE